MGFIIAYLLGILTAVETKQNKEPYCDNETSTHCRHSPPDRPLSVMCVPPPETEEERTEKTKKKRRKTIKFWIGNLTLLVLAAYTITTILMWCSMRHANQIAHTALVLSQRPWVTETDIRFENPPKFSAHDAKSQVQLSLDISGVLKNVGLSAAVKSQADWTILPVDKPGFPSRFMPCLSPIRNKKIEFDMTAIFLMPHDEIPSNTTISINPEGFRITNVWSIWAQACIPYEDTFGNVYQTKLIYHSITRDDSIPIMAMQGHDLTYKPIIGWNLWSTTVEP